MRGTSCWGICSAAARKRLGSGALSRALHSGGEVAAGGRSVLRGKAGEAQREGKKQWRRSGATRGAVLQAGGGSLAVPQWRVAQRCLPAAWSRAGMQAGGRRKGTSLQFPKFQGPNCKPAITFNLGLK